MAMCSGQQRAVLAVAVTLLTCSAHVVAGRGTDTPPLHAQSFTCIQEHAGHATAGYIAVLQEGQVSREDAQP